jgi:cell division initiation protein
MTMGDAMRITPLDIQQMVFKASFRGYDKEEVNRFLEELAQTIESLNRDQAIQREKIVFLEQQLAELKRTEATLSSTLLSAQSLAEDVKRNAQREADLVIKEAELKAGELIRRAGVELTDTQRDLSSLQKQRLLMVERLRASLRMFERMLEVEEQEALHDAAIASEEKLEGESSPAL